MVNSKVWSSITRRPLIDWAFPFSLSATPRISLKYKSATGDSVRGSAARSKDHRKSSATTGLPS